jgi:lactoylglutathione lyase
MIGDEQLLPEEIASIPANLQAVEEGHVEFVHPDLAADALKELWYSGWVWIAGGLTLLVGVCLMSAVLVSASPTSQWVPLTATPIPPSLTTRWVLATATPVPPSSTSRWIPPTATSVPPAKPPEPTRPPVALVSPLPVRNCPGPEVCITYPQMNDTLRGIVPIRGTATRSNFAYYKFEYKPEGAGTWNFLVRFDRPVTNGVLMDWHTTTVRPGVYWLRLIVVDKTGNYWPEFAELRVIVAENIQSTHARLLVSDFRACFLFYRDVLELPVTWGEENGDYASYRVGETELALLQRQLMADAVGTAAKPAQAESQDRVAMIFQVDDVDEVYQRLRDKGVVFINEPMDCPDWGIRAAHFRDPDGNLLEIYTDLPPEPEEDA